jgi:hypothetical protein
MLLAVTDSGEDCSIQLNQRAFLRPVDVDPGQLLINGELINVRSEDELRIVQLLKTASIKVNSTQIPIGHEILSPGSPVITGDDIRQSADDLLEKDVRRLRDDIVAFVESDEYLRIARI